MRNSNVSSKFNIIEFAPKAVVGIDANDSKNKRRRRTVTENVDNSNNLLDYNILDQYNASDDESQKAVDVV